MRVSVGPHSLTIFCLVSSMSFWIRGADSLYRFNLSEENMQKMHEIAGVVAVGDVDDVTFFSG